MSPAPLISLPQDTAPTPRADPPVVGMRVVGFVVGETVLGLPITRVREIIPYEAPVAVPRVDPCFEGFLSVRGRTVPVIALRARFDIPPDESAPPETIILCDLEAGTVGYAADRVTTIVTLDAVAEDTALLRAFHPGLRQRRRPHWR